MPRHLFPTATEECIGIAAKTGVASAKPQRQTLQMVTASVHAARNPQPTSRRHILLQLYGVMPDGLACRVQKYSCAQGHAAAASGKETGEANPVSRRQESIRRLQQEELAPGGHQEQGESRVTVFRAPDWGKKHRVPKWRNDIATAPLAKEYQRMRMNAT